MRRRASSNSAARCGRPEVLSAPIERLLPSLQFYRTRVRGCARRTRSAFCGKRYRKRAFLPEPPRLPWGPSMTRKAKQKAKAQERDQARQGYAGAHADARPEVAGEPDCDRGRRGCGVRQPGGSGEWRDEAGGGRRFGNRGGRETFCWEPSAGDQGANAERAGG